jgi:ribosomal-protein-alanine N-acetyltransferase
MAGEDLDAVLAIEAASFKKPWTRAQFESELRNPVSSALTLRLDGALAAYMVFWTVHGEAHILNIAVRPDLRRMGMASELIGYALDVMRKRAVFEVFLEVRRSNDAAIELYGRFGFREAFERRNYYGDEDAIVMALEM